MKARIAVSRSCLLDDEEGTELDEEPEAEDRSGALLRVADGVESSRAPTSAAPPITASASNMTAAATHGQDDRPTRGRVLVAGCAPASVTTTGGTATGSAGVACRARVPSRSDAAIGGGWTVTPDLWSRKSR